MLDFAVEHITAIDTITADRDMKLRQYELSEDDWDMARHLRDVLKVFPLFSYFLCFLTHLDLQRCHFIFFPRDTQHRDHYSSDGSH